MTETGSEGHEESVERYEQALGRLTRQAWGLEQAIVFIGQGVGLEVDHEFEHRRAVDALIRHIAQMIPAPWWGPEATPDALRSWLESAARCLTDRDAFVAAFSPMRWSPKIFDPETSQQADLTLADYERLTERCQDAIAEGRKLLSDLMLPIMAGGGLAGYHGKSVV